MARAVALACALLLAAAAVAAADLEVDSNEVAPRLVTPDDLLWEIADECVGATGGMHCLRRKVLAFLEAQGAGRARGAAAAAAAAGRALLPSDQQLDEQILERVRSYVDAHQFRLQLPELFFQRATLTFRPARGLHNFQVHFPEEEGARDASQARDMMKKKMLLPLLMLVKLKMKALTPILLGLIGLKATKALVLSKVAILLVVGFLVVQLCKKLGMGMPMPMPMPEMPPATAYGAPASSPPSDSYAPAGWDSGANGNGNGNGVQGGPYSRVWTPSDPHQMAYNYYAPQHASSQLQQQQQPSK